MGKIRVLLADDHQAIVERVCGLLSEEFDIIGRVNNGRDAVMTTLRLNPDVLVIDISMPVLTNCKRRSNSTLRRLGQKLCF